MKKYLVFQPIVSGGFINLNVDKMSTLKGLIPKDIDIEDNIDVQKFRVSQGKNYCPISIEVERERFELILKEVRSKVVTNSTLSKLSNIIQKDSYKVLDIVYDNETLPIIQIKEKDDK